MDHEELLGAEIIAGQWPQVQFSASYRLKQFQNLAKSYGAGYLRRYAQRTRTKYWGAGAAMFPAWQRAANELGLQIECFHQGCTSNVYVLGLTTWGIRSED